MSFSQDVKNEILHRKIVRSCCVTAAAYAVACFGKYFDDRGVVLQTENEGIAQLAQKLYARCGITGTVISKERGTGLIYDCLLYTSPSPRDMRRSRMPSSA